MRSVPTPAEAALWYHLRAHRFSGAKFRRQTVIGPFIADFTCRTAMLVIEIDGDTHGLRTKADAQRTELIEKAGWRVVRFSNAEVMGNIEAVPGRIEALLIPSP
ncbi:MAG: endonuclease domain-containing protein [Sphingobium sp.]|nr:endonuclease domain-containing protein [Sphingobium sp.]